MVCGISHVFLKASFFRRLSQNFFFSQLLSHDVFLTTSFSQCFSQNDFLTASFPQRLSHYVKILMHRLPYFLITFDICIAFGPMFDTFSEGIRPFLQGFIKFNWLQRDVDVGSQSSLRIPELTSQNLQQKSYLLTRKWNYNLCIYNLSIIYL